MSPGIMLRQTTSEDFYKSLATNPHEFLTPSSSLYTSALASVKVFLDPLAVATSEAQESRSSAARKKRKRRKADDGESERSALQLKELHLDGFTSQAIWGQARRILDSTASELERNLALRANVRQAKHINTNGGVRTVRFDGEGFEVDSNEEDGGIGADGSEIVENGLQVDASQDELRQRTRVNDDFEEDDVILGDPEDEDEDIREGYSDDDETAEGSAKTLIKDRHGLNDGFFDIDDFNKESEFMEQAGDNGNDDDESDDDEVDYWTNPMETSRSQDAERSGNKLRRKKPTSPDDTDEDENGPVFADADISAPWSDDEDEDNGLDLDDTGIGADDESDNANDIQYADFFDPPARSLTKSKRMRALPKTQPEQSLAPPSEQDIQRTIDSVRRDLFEDDFSDPEEASDAPEDTDLPRSANLSSHEKRKLALSKQIRELEAAAIEKRQWQLSGEASANARPENALLEEDLDFERTGKPVPVITAELSSSIEDIIKRRILNRQFDEVIKRRPGEGSSTQANGQHRRGLLELSDQKDPQSLAESYEQSYLTSTDPNAKDTRPESLKAQHAEIEKLWADVSGTLDALTSFRYKPKSTSLEVKVVTDAPKVLMEEARPSGVEGVRGEESGLAPQEVFEVGKTTDREKAGIVVTKGGGVASKDELSREEKLRRRRREKERLKKQESNRSTTSNSNKPDKPQVATRKDDQSDTLKQLKAGGVKVIGKGGELRDVEGQRVNNKPSSSAGAYRL